MITTTTMTMIMITTTEIMTTIIDPPMVIQSEGLELRPAGDLSVRVFPEDLNIRQKESWVLTGPSGCGKTTLVNTLCGLLRPSSGSLQVLGTALDELSPGARDRFRGQRIGMVHQEFHLLPGFTAVENLEIALRFSKAGKGHRARKHALSMLETAGLSHRANTRVERLSRGEAQRVAVARALVHEPELLFTDEPTASLDAERGQMMLDWIDKLRGQTDCTWICVTHDPQVAARFDHQLDARNWQQAEVAS